MMRAGQPAPIDMWVADPPDADVAKALERLARTDDIVRLAVMPDVHLAKDVCVGVALATESLLFPSAVGGDIGCGMAAIRLNCDGDVLSDERSVGQLLSQLYARIPITKHSATGAHDSEQGRPNERNLSHGSLEKRKSRDGVLQLGTLGRGNHFIEFQVDESDAVWLMVHSGSRAMGQAIQAHHLKNATPSSTGLRYLVAHSAGGEAYLNDVRWALDYASANREAMVDAVVEIMKHEHGVDADRTSFISCHHNFVDREDIDGRSLWVHRKGAISARAGEPGLVPGSMGTPSFHVRGRGCDRSLFSSSHGAGRVMSRSVARRSISVKALKRQMTHVWFDHRMARRLVDEAPSAYKDISAVMRAQNPLTRIVRKLRPVLSFKGG